MGKDDSVIVAEKRQIASSFRGEMPGFPATEDLEPGEVYHNSALLPYYGMAQAKSWETEEAYYVGKDDCIIMLRRRHIVSGFILKDTCPHQRHYK